MKYEKIDYMPNEEVAQQGKPLVYIGELHSAINGTGLRFHGAIYAIEGHRVLIGYESTAQRDKQICRRTLAKSETTFEAEVEFCRKFCRRQWVDVAL